MCMNTTASPLHTDALRSPSKTPVVMMETQPLACTQPDPVSKAHSGGGRQGPTEFHTAGHSWPHEGAWAPGPTEDTGPRVLGTITR